MRVSVNNREQDVPEGLTVRALMELLGVDPRRTSVALNGRVLLIAEYDTTRVSPGDAVRTIRMLAGG